MNVAECTCMWSDNDDDYDVDILSVFSPIHVAVLVLFGGFLVDCVWFQVGDSNVSK